MSKKIKSDYDIEGELLATTVKVRGGLGTQYLMADGTRSSTAVSSPLTTKGDLYTWDTTNQRLARGTDGYVLSANSATVTGLEWIVPSSGGASLTKAVAQTTHGLAVGNAIRHNGTIWVKAQANALANSGAIGIVSAVGDANNFTYAFGGFLGTGTWTNGASYFLSPAVAGAIIVEPSYVSGQVREFIGTGTPDGLLLEFDLGDEITTGVVVAWADITGKPTTIAGYGITDFNSLGDARWSALETFDRVSLVLTGAVVFSDFTILNGQIQAVNTRSLTAANIGALATGITTLTGYGISDTMANFDVACSNGNFAYQASTIVVANHGTASTAEVVNVCYGTTATAPAVGTTTVGTIYIQYIP